MDYTEVLKSDKLVPAAVGGVAVYMLLKLPVLLIVAGAYLYISNKNLSLLDPASITSP
jgi:hypothetical protein